MIFEEFYKKECLPQVQKDLGIKNPMRVPRLKKVIVSSAPNGVTQDSKLLDRVVTELEQITGQKSGTQRPSSDD